MLVVSGPWTASIITALSRTLMLTTWPTEKPPQPSPRSGPDGLRARVGFRPNTPEAEAGMRIEPPPSLACAIGRMRAAGAAPAPTARRPAGGMRDIPGIAGRTVQARLRGRHQPELRARALAEDRDTRIDEAL